MKKRASFITVLLAALLVFSIGMSVSAAAPEPKAGGEAPAIVLNESPEHDSDSVETSDENTSVVQGESPDNAAPKKGGNTPFFVGAGIAILMFAGVAVYCKTNGNKSY